MDKSDTALAQVVEYMRAHWPSKVKSEWQVGIAEYPAILEKVMAELTTVEGEPATQTRKLVRIAGISGAGKTTQLMPAVEEYFSAQNLRPVLVAARIFAPYHPHYQEILECYGESEVRKMTDEFSTILMFMTLRALTERGYDIILDVTLLDPAVEGILVKMTAGYEYLMLLIAVSPEVTARHLAGRAWRHSAETEQEFIRATSKALEFYAIQCPEMQTVVWNTFDVEPVYEGAAAGCLKEFEKWSAEPDREEVDAEVRKRAKIEFLKEFSSTVERPA